MAIEYTESALKRGYTPTEIEWVMFHPRAYVPDFEEARLPGHNPPHLWIGYAPDGDLLEIMAEPRHERVLEVFHVMPARAKFITRYP